MKKKTVNELEKGYSGIFGAQVALVNRKGKSIMVMQTKKAKVEPRGNQVKSQDNFTLAARYAKNILLDPDMLVLKKDWKGLTKRIAGAVKVARMFQII